MTRAAVLLFRPAATVAFSIAVPRAVAGIWRGCTKGMHARYRPELHYMRGPGPKWREKHAQVDTARSTSRQP